MKTKTYYKNFQLTTDNCKDEPIHRPSAVHGDALLLVLDRQTHHISAISDNFLQLLGLEKEEGLDQNHSAVLQGERFEELSSHLGEEKWGAINPVNVEIKGRKFDVIGHLAEDLLILEFEPHQQLSNEPFYKELQRLIGILDDCKEEQVLFEAMAQEVKSFSGYDRVMIYRFDEDYNGEVVGEAKEAHLEPFSGLHYPATDIPPLARRLFLENRSRIIPNIYTPASPVHLSDKLDLPQGLDLSHSQHRATSPIHIEYLHNMGVAATLTIAIIVDQKLWGLIANHHYSPYSIPYPRRKIAEVMAATFAQRIVRLEKDRMKRESRDFLKAERALIQRLQSKKEENFTVQLWDAQPSISDLCSADGSALVVGEEVVWSRGKAPSNRVILELIELLKKKGQEDEFITHSVVDSLGVSPDFMPECPGMMSMGISVEKPIFLMWFKGPFNQQVSWGGNPNEAFIEEKREGVKGIRLSPRKSFAKWNELVMNQSASWQPYEKAMLHRLREAIIRSELNRSGEAIRSLNNRLAAILNKELDQIIYIASHDLQEPLRTINSFGKLLERSAEDKLTQDERFFLERITLASDRMKMLVTNLLDYSRIGRSLEVEAVDLNQVLEETKEDLAQKIKETGAAINVASLPVITGDFIELKRLFQNLISNALKYHRKGVPPVIDIKARKEKSSWHFEVSDNGIGMEKQYLQKIFMLFQRLHSKDEYEGTGIGLAQCKKIVEAYAGDIYADSEPGKGTVMHLNLKDKQL